MTVSVILPARNAAAYLQRAVDSVLGQTWTDWELIVVNNGSDDGTGAIMASCVRAHPDRIIGLDEPVAGASRARNAGLARATGEWIQFLDADDELAPDKLAHQAALITPGTDWIIGGYRVDDPTGYLHDNVPHEDPWRGLVFGYRIGYTCSNLFRRTALDRVGGWNESLPDNTDPELHFRLLVAETPYRIDPAIKTYYHHQGAAGLSVRHAVGGNQRRVTLYARVIAHLIRERPAYWAEHDQFFFGALIRALRVLATHDLEEATEAYAAYFDPAEGWHHAIPPALNPKYTVLYSCLGFRNTEMLRKWLGRQKRMTIKALRKIK